MFRKKNMNPAIYNEAAVKAGAHYVPDGAPSQYGNPLLSQSIKFRSGQAQSEY